MNLPQHKLYKELLCYHIFILHTMNEFVYKIYSVKENLCVK